MFAIERTSWGIMQPFALEGQAENGRTVKDILECHVAVYTKPICNGTNPVRSECPFRIDIGHL